MTPTRVHSIEYRLLLLLLALAVMTPVASAQANSREITYVSRGKNPPADRGTFVLQGSVGHADYRLNGLPFVTAALHFYLEQESVTDPGIRFLIFREDGKTRLWSFQLNGASHGKSVIYINESGQWWLPNEWKFYDLSHIYPESPEAVTYERVVIPVASPVYYSRVEPARCCWWFFGLFHHHWW